MPLEVWMLYCQLTINVSDWLLNVSVGVFVGVVCLPRVTDFSTVAKFEEHARECRIMGVVSHYKQAVRYGRCVSESEREFVGTSERL